jgi:Caudovirus prohead protease.
MKPSTIEVPPLDLRAAIGDVNDAARTVDLTFTTGADVVRFDWETGLRFIERLSMDPKHIRLDRLNAGAPLLDSHSAYSIASQIGVVEPGSVTLTSKEGRATVRFSKRADVEPFYQDVRDGIIRNVSVGYRVHRFEETAPTSKSAMPVRLATDWEPYEISMVPMGADAGARVRSSKDVPTNLCVMLTPGHTDDADRARRLRLARARY